MKAWIDAWIGVDLDGTLARSDSAHGDNIGEPIEPMVRRVKEWVVTGINVKIMTARVCCGDPQDQRSKIEQWCAKHIGTVLPITNEKDYGMIELWDDRAVQVIPNTGQRADSDRRYSI